MLDASRQWPTCYKQIAAHHFYRYKFASEVTFGRVLDAACGTGYGSAMLNVRVAGVVGVDKSHQAISWANEFFPGPKYIPGSIEDRPWVGSFDSVVSLETIEHVKDPSAVLKPFKESCLGILVASVPNEERYPFKAENYMKDESPHFRHYRPMEFDRLLEDNGFKVRERFCQVGKNDPLVVKGTDGMFLVYIAEAVS